MVVSIYIRWKKNLDDQGAVQTTWLQPEEFSLNWTSSWRMAVWKKQQYIKDCWLPRQMTCILSLDVKPSQTLRVRDFCLFFFFFFTCFKIFFYIFLFDLWIKLLGESGIWNRGKQRRWRSKYKRLFQIYFSFSLTKVEKWLKHSTFCLHL